MKTYEIDVHLVNAADPAKGKVFQVAPETGIGLRNGSSQKVERVFVTWKFHRLPSGLTPVITFESPEVIVSGPTTVLGSTPKITFELEFPRPIKAGDQHHLRYRIATLPAETKADVPPVPVEPTLVIDTSGPPTSGDGKPPHTRDPRDPQEG